MSYNSDLQSNNEELLEILNTVNELPEAGSGEAGSDGFSPIATVTQTDDGAVISITDKNGTTTATVNHGKDGRSPTVTLSDYSFNGETGVDIEVRNADGTGTIKSVRNGKDGTSALASVSKAGKVTTITTQDASGTKTAEVLDGTDGITPHIGANGNWFIGETDTGKPSRGEDGQDGNDGNDGKDGTNGNDGVSPTVAVSKSGKTTTISITDKNGTKTATVNDGADGKTPVPGVDYFTEADKEEFLDDIDAVKKTEMFTIRQEITPDYTNLVPTSVDENGDIFNGCGWMSGKQISANGSAADSTTGTFVSGFIRVKPGDVVRIKDPNRSPFSTGVSFALYKESKATGSGMGKNVAAIQGANNNDCGVLTIDGNVATWTLNPINYYTWRDFAWMRVTTFSADMIETINEPLTESVKEQLILKPTVKVTRDSIEGDVSGKPLSGKTVVGFGDSIFGYVRDTTSVLSVVAKETGATVHNVGFGGCRMSVHPTNGYAAFSMWALAKAITENDWTTQDAQAASGSSYFPEHLALLKSIDFNAVDMVVIHYGSNDFMGGGSGVAIDNANDPDDYTTMCGALRYSVEKLITAYPHLQIFVSLPTYFYKPDTGKYPDTYINAQGKYYAEYVNALRNTAVEYNLPVIDSFYGLGVNKLNVATMTSDGAHHSQIGRQRLGEFIAGHLSGRQNSVRPDGGQSGIDTDAVNALISAAIGDAIGGSY